MAETMESSVREVVTAFVMEENAAEGVVSLRDALVRH
jgi:hypothetical protein